MSKYLETYLFLCGCITATCIFTTADCFAGDVAAPNSMPLRAPPVGTRTGRDFTSAAMLDTAEEMVGTRCSIQAQALPIVHSVASLADCSSATIISCPRACFSGLREVSRSRT